MVGILDDEGFKEITSYLLRAIVLFIFAYAIVREVMRPRTRYVEVIRDEQGRIKEVVERIV